MQRHSKVLLSALIAVVLLGAIATGALANRLRLVNSERGFRIVWTPMTFSVSTGAVIRCNATLEGTFHSSTFVKTRNLLIGYVTRAGTTVASCTGGRASFLTATLPWHVTYRAFTGTLPSIRSVQISLIGLSTTLEDGAYFCLSRTTAANPGGFNLNTVREAGGQLELPSVNWDESLIIPLEPGGVCEFVTWQYSGAARFTTIGSATTLKVVLI
jgi:hypothetical protein